MRITSALLATLLTLSATASMAQEAVPAASAEPKPAPAATEAAHAAQPAQVPDASQPAASTTPGASGLAGAGLPSELTKPDDTSPITAELMDGSVVQFNTDGSIQMVGADGKKRTPPDGTMTLRDGTTFSIDKGFRSDE